MRHRFSLRVRTDFRVTARWGARRALCRGVEISSSGIVLDGWRLPADGSSLWVWLDLELPERLRPMRALARPVWSFGTLRALKFVRLSDADRLSLAEHVDLHARRGALLN